MDAAGYIDDVPYVRAFIPELSPAWLDFTALLWSFAPTDQSAGFAWCDLGCGQGVNAVAFAAAHPTGQFHGVDFMPAHIDNARGLARAAGVDNAHFHAADFRAAAELDLPKFDYITAHGVYSWVDDPARDDLLWFIDKRLKPGGRVYISYNALPGRAPDAPFQRLMFELGSRFEGDSAQQVRQAVGFAARLQGVNTAALSNSPMARAFLQSKARRDPSYLAHELMGANWRPAYVTDVRRALARIGLMPAGSATLLENFDDYVLCAAAQRLLDKIDDPDLRELVRDYLIDQSFRRDVFIREGAEIDESERRQKILATPFALARPKALVEYEVGTAAGEIAFANPIARRMVRELAKGPRPLSDLAPANTDRDDLIANAMILAGARQIWPVSAEAANVARFNQVVLARAGGPEQLNLLLLACGAAVGVSTRVLTDLSHGGSSRKGATSAWRDYYAAHGVGITET